MSAQSAAESLDLVRRAKEGDLDAFDRLFARYYDRVRRIVRLRLGRHLQPAVETEDILQETFVAAVRAFDHFEVREEARLIDWLGKIAENRIRAAARHARAEKRDRRREQAIDHIRTSLSSGCLVIQPAASVTLPDVKAMRDEEVGILEECIAELKDEYREVIVLRDYEGASWELVAELMQSPSANASRMLHARALVALATAVGGRR